MNTKFKLNRRIVITISILLTAMWLSLAAQAQGFQKNSDLVQGSHALAMHDSQDLRGCEHSHDRLAFLSDFNNRIHAERVGFAETNPAYQQSPDTQAVSLTSNNRVRQTYVGFAESDPAYQQSLGGVTILQTSNNQVQQSYVGFAETEPAMDLYLSGEEINSRIFVNCHDENGESMVHEEPRFSNLTEEGIHHDHC